MEDMELVEADSVLKKIFYRYLQEPFIRIKERWLAYFARFAMDDEPSAMDVGTEIQSSEEFPIKERTKSVRSARKSEVEDREESGIGGCTFVTTALGATLGMGHFWRFPNLAWKFGGGAFLVIYVGFMLLFGTSLFFMEVALGQYSSLSSLKIFDRIPLLQGVGYSMLACGYAVSTYYSYTAGVGIYYLTSSLGIELPWSRCPVQVTSNMTVQCLFTKGPTQPRIMTLQCPSSGKTSVDFDRFCDDFNYQDKIKEKCCGKTKNCSVIIPDVMCSYPVDPATYYWRSTFNGAKSLTLERSNLQLLLCSFSAWFLIFLFAAVGMKYIGIISTAILPFLLLSLLLMLVVSLSDQTSEVGISEYFVPHTEDFLNRELWLTALSHVIFSLALGTGPVITLGSISKFRNRCTTSIFLVCLLLTFVSLLSGTVVFSIIARISARYRFAFDYENMGLSGLSMIAYSYILTQFPVPWLSSSVFFLLLALVIALSLGGLLASLSAAIGEVVKITRNDRYVLAFLLAFSSFILTIPMTFKGGLIIFSLMDNFSVRIALPFICLGEVLFVCIYGLRLFGEDIAFMMGSQLSIYFFEAVWLVYPFAVVGLIVFMFLSYNLVYWSKTVSLIKITIMGVILFPMAFFMLKNLLKYSILCKPRQLVRPPPGDGPKSEELKALRTEFKLHGPVSEPSKTPRSI